MSSKQLTPGFGPIYSPLLDTCGDDPEKGGWFLPLPHHLFEASLLSLIFGWLFVRHLRAHRASIRLTEQARHKHWLESIVDVVCVVLLIVSICTIIFHKYQGNKMCFLFQPCHVMHILLLIIFLLGRRGALLFSVYLHLLFGPFLGLVSADLACYTQPWELENWALQHVMLLLVPIYFILVRRYALYSGLSFFLVAFSAKVLFHFLVLLPVGLVTSCNLNYMLCPPAGTPLVAMGSLYRLAMVAFCAFLSWLLRYALLGNLMKAIEWCRGNNAKANKKEQ